VVQKRAAGLYVAREEGAGHKRYGHHLGGRQRRTCGSSRWPMAFKNSSHR
jgi:hypothetical protein